MMKAGTYYVGDLCYPIPDEIWQSDVCKTIIQGNDVVDGEFTLTDGTPYAIYTTAHGDGRYDGCSVDSGTIGCIGLEDALKIGHIDEARMRQLGRVETFTRDFETSENDGQIAFGHITIETNPPYCGMCGNKMERWEDERYGGECEYCYHESQEEDEDVA